MQLEWILLIAVVIAFGAMVWQGRKRKYFKVYLANHDVQLLYKTVGDWWFRESGARQIFRTEDGSLMVFPDRGHWILFYVEVRDVEAAKKEVAAINQRKAENQ